MLDKKLMKDLITHIQENKADGPMSVDDTLKQVQQLLGEYSEIVSENTLRTVITETQKFAEKLALIAEQDDSTDTPLALCDEEGE